jgi:hypothetical protein
LPPQRREVLSCQGSPYWSICSPHISGAQRLSSGNTLICEGQWGRIFEVTPTSEIVWEYINPFSGPHHGTRSNWVFRAYRYAPDSPQIGGRLNANGR